VHRLDQDRKGCEGTLSRHFRVEGHEVHFSPPHLRIVRERAGTVVVDREIGWMDEKSPLTCRRPAALRLWSLHIDRRKRVMALGVGTCDQEGCPSTGWRQYVRLQDGTR
jgi:hypothetical protein